MVCGHQYVWSLLVSESGGSAASGDGGGPFCSASAGRIFYCTGAEKRTEWSTSAPTTPTTPPFAVS